MFLWHKKYVIWPLRVQIQSFWHFTIMQCFFICTNKIYSYFYTKDRFKLQVTHLPYLSTTTLALILLHTTHKPSSKTFNYNVHNHTDTFLSSLTYIKIGTVILYLYNMLNSKYLNLKVLNFSSFFSCQFFTHVHSKIVTVMFKNIVYIFHSGINISYKQPTWWRLITALNNFSTESTWCIIEHLSGVLLLWMEHVVQVDNMAFK